MLQAATCSTSCLGGRPHGRAFQPAAAAPQQQQRRASDSSTTSGSSRQRRQQQAQALCSSSSSSSCHHHHQLQHHRGRLVAAAAAGGSGPSSPSPSSFEGSSVAKELQQAAALDELIDLLLAAKSQGELSRLVAENIFSFDPKFWMRVATRNDSLVDAADKDRLRGVADAVMLLVDAMVKQTEAQLNDSASLLQTILRAAADANGEWYLPLEPAQVAAVRASLEAHADRLDEALLSNCFAWMKKCQDDRMDTMVLLLQKVLQLYAGQVLRGPEADGPEGVLNEVVWAEEQEWDAIIRKHAAAGDVAEAAFMEALQKKMELAVLGMQSGSYAQRVQAEYLKEVEARAKAVYRQLAAAGKQ